MFPSTTALPTPEPKDTVTETDAADGELETETVGEAVGFVVGAGEIVEVGVWVGDEDCVAVGESVAAAADGEGDAVGVDVGTEVGIEVGVEVATGDGVEVGEMLDVYDSPT